MSLVRPSRLVRGRDRFDFDQETVMQRAARNDRARRPVLAEDA
jgi:hypothetical protein